MNKFVPESRLRAFDQAILFPKLVKKNSEKQLGIVKKSKRFKTPGKQVMTLTKPSRNPS